MKMVISSVSKVSKEGESIPRICLSGNWLSQVGFEPDSLVQAIPETDGIMFTSYDENIRSYRELVKETKQQNGKLFSIMLASQNQSKYPKLATVGKYIESKGLAVGDILILRSDDGKIQARKFDPSFFGISSSEPLQMLLVSDGKKKKESLPKPQIRLGRAWLSESGFEKNAYVSVRSESELLTCTLEKEGLTNYRGLVKHARQNRLQLIQTAINTSCGKRKPYLAMSGSMLSRSGFGMGDLVAVTHTYGQIQCRKISWEQLGFSL